MRQKLLKRIFLLPLSGLIMLMWGCVHGNDTRTYPETSTSTLVMYMLANNNLAGAMENNVNAMMSAVGHDFPDIYNILVYWDGNDGSRLSQVVRPATRNGAATLEVLKDYGKHDSTDPAVMKGVMSDIKTLSPSDHYGIVLGSHGTGWFPTDIRPNSQNRARALTGVAGEHDLTVPLDAEFQTRWFGQDGSKYMSIDKLVEGLSPIVFDFMLFDACFMASAESLYDMRESADYIIASPVEIISDGFPFARIIPALFLNDYRVSLEERLANVCDIFVNYYRQKNGNASSAAITLVDMSKMEALAGSVARIMNGSTKQFSLGVVQFLERITVHAFFDLYDYMLNVCSDVSNFALFESAFNDTILYEGHTTNIYSAYGGTFAASRVHGIASYIPRRSLPNTAAAYFRTDWGSMMGDFVLQD